MKRKVVNVALFGWSDHLLFDDRPTYDSRALKRSLDARVGDADTATLKKRMAAEASEAKRMMEAMT